MKNGAKIFVLSVVCGLALGIAVFFYLNNKRTVLRYQDTIRELQTEYKRITELLGDSQRTVDRIAESIATAAERVGEISGRIGDALSAVEASIRITEELLGLIDLIGAAIDDYEKRMPP